LDRSLKEIYMLNPHSWTPEVTNPGINLLWVTPRSPDFITRNFGLVERYKIPVLLILLTKINQKIQTHNYL
jgi:hypothetical protein